MSSKAAVRPPPRMAAKGLIASLRRDIFMSCPGVRRAARTERRQGSCQGRGGAQRALVRDLDWIEAERDYVRLHVGARSYLIRNSIRGLVERLDPEAFVRIHRSAVVRRDRVTQLAPRPGGGSTAVRSTCARPAVGRSHAAAVRRLFRRPSGRTRAFEPLEGR